MVGGWGLSDNEHFMKFASRRNRRRALPQRPARGRARASSVRFVCVLRAGLNDAGDESNSLGPVWSGPSDAQGGGNSESQADATAAPATPTSLRTQKPGPLWHFGGAIAGPSPSDIPRSAIITDKELWAQELHPMRTRAVPR